MSLKVKNQTTDLEFAPVVVVDIPVLLFLQVSDAFIDIRKELVLVSRQCCCEADVVGNVVASENHVFRFRKVKVLDDDLQLFHKSCRGERCELAAFELILQFASAVEHEGECGKMGRFDFIDGFCGGQGMSWGRGQKVGPIDRGVRRSIYVFA